MIFNLVNFSRKKISEKIAIITGETKQSYNAGIEGPINSTAEYKKKDKVRSLKSLLLELKSKNLKTLLSSLHSFGKFFSFYST